MAILSGSERPSVGDRQVAMCYLLGESESDDIDPHLKSGFPLLWRIVVGFRISPTIADVAFIRVVHDQPAIMEQTEAFRGLAFMFMVFG